MSPFLLLAALFPAAALLVRVYRLDKIEKEPPRVLWTLIGCGAVAALAAYALQCVLLRLLDGWLPAGGLGNLIVRNFLIVACSEELCKRLPVRTVLWRHPAFDYRFDAVVYCVFSALGFAALENVLYVAESGLRTAVMRALLSVPGHFFFAVYMGIYLGEAKVCERSGQRRRRGYYLLCSLAVPVLLLARLIFAYRLYSVDPVLANYYLELLGLMLLILASYRLSGFAVQAGGPRTFGFYADLTAILAVTLLADGHSAALLPLGGAAALEGFQRAMRMSGAAKGKTEE